MRTDGGKGRETENSAHPADRPSEFQVDGRGERGSDGGLFVGQVLDGRNPETAPNGAMHYRENLDVGFRVAGFRSIPSWNCIVALTFNNQTLKTLYKFLLRNASISHGCKIKLHFKR